MANTDLQKFKTAIADVNDRIESREKLRDRINGAYQLEKITVLLEVLEQNAQPYTPQGTANRACDTLNREQVSGIKAVLDYRIKLLNKVLPDIKAIELTGEAGEPLSGNKQTINSDDMEAIAQIGTYLAKRRREVIDITPEKGTPESLSFLQ